MGRKFTIFALCYFVFESKFHVQAPPGGGLIFGGAIKRRVFLRYDFERLVFGEAYTWRGLFSEFDGVLERRI